MGLPAGQTSCQKRCVVAPPVIVSVACRLAVRVAAPETQVSVMFCGVLTPAVKVSVAALVRVKLAASAPVMLKLPRVVVAEAAPPEPDRHRGGLSSQGLHPQRVCASGRDRRLRRLDAGRLTAATEPYSWR